MRSRQEKCTRAELSNVFFCIREGVPFEMHTSANRWLIILRRFGNSLENSKVERRAIYCRNVGSHCSSLHLTNRHFSQEDIHTNKLILQKYYVRETFRLHQGPIIRR